MKILHTADWHLGHRLHEQSQHEEQTLFLTWLEDYIKKQEIQILLVAGDIFDVGVPSAQSLKMYYDFLVNLKNTGCKHIVITGGNHDSPGTLNAPKELLNALSIKVVGKATDDIQEEIFTLKVADEEIIVAAVPYLRDQDIRRAVEGETFDDITQKYKMALINHYNEAAAYCESIKKLDTPVLAMGHLFAMGGSVSDSEQNIYVGTLGHIGGNDFPTTFDYIALGHLHRPQIVGDKKHIRYSGAPVTLSFSELDHRKKVVIINTSEGKISKINEEAVPTFREINKVSGEFEDCIAALNTIKTNAYNLRPWVEVELEPTEGAIFGFNEVQEKAKNLDLDVIKVSYSRVQKTKGIEQFTEQTKHIKELEPLSVFKMKCKEQEFDLESNQEILDAFQEAVNLAREVNEL